jgi:hypothetical protein
MLWVGGATARTAVKRPPHGPSRRYHAHSVWEPRVEEPAAGTVPVAAAGGKDLQPAPHYPARGHQSGNAVPGREMECSAAL